jgi:crotonobetaine/carnitine-CoA ligase
MTDTLQSLPDVLYRRATETPDQEFLRDVSGKQRTFSQLLDGIHQKVALLNSLGVTPGDAVVAQLPTSLEAIELWLGTAWMTALYAPINRDYVGVVLAQQVALSRAKIAFVSAEWYPRFIDILETCPDLQTLIILGADADFDFGKPSRQITCLTFEAALAGLNEHGASDEMLPAPGAHNISSILYTSGTTGPSKAVLVPWGQWAHSNVLTDLGPDTVYYCPYPFYHGSGHISLIFMAEIGGRVVVRDGFSARDFWDEIDAHGCTITLLIPAMIDWLLGQERRSDDASRCLTHAISAPLTPSTPIFAERFGVSFRTLFGMTEVGHPFAGDTHETFSHYTSCGRVRAGYDVRLVDDLDRPVAVGEPGELIVRTETPWTLNQGYLGQPEVTAAAWRNGWFHTGDMFRQDESGRYYFVDRRKDALRRRGENISSFDIERCVLAHPGVAEAAAIGVPSGEGDQEIKVCVVATDPALTPERLYDEIHDATPRLMRPRYIEFVDDLPKTPATARVQKAKLRETPFTERTWDRQTRDSKPGAQA